MTPTPSPQARAAAVEAMRAIAEEGFVVGCCCMSETDADEMASYLAPHLARFEQTIRAQAIANALETAAKVAELNGFSMNRHRRAQETADDIAAAIRSLKEQDHG